MENTILVNALPVCFILLFLALMVGCFMVSHNRRNKNMPRGKKNDK